MTRLTERMTTCVCYQSFIGRLNGGVLDMCTRSGLTWQINDSNYFIYDYMYSHANHIVVVIWLAIIPYYIIQQFVCQHYG